MFCSICNKKNEDGAKFCNECGALLQPSKSATNSDTIQFSHVDNTRKSSSPSGAKFDEFSKGTTAVFPAVSAKPKEFIANESVAKKSDKKIYLLVAIGFILIAVLIAGSSYQLEFWGGKNIPDVVGMNQYDAEVALQQSGFKVDILQTMSDDVEGRVVFVDPGAGRRVSENSTIHIHVAIPRIVPSVIGLELDRAKQKFEECGYTNVKYAEVKSNESENRVLDILPAAGTTLSSGSDIEVKFSVPYIVPDVIDLPEAEAVSILEKEGYVVSLLYTYDDGAANAAISTNPAAGTKLPSGETVELTVVKSWSDEIVSSTKAYINANSVLNVSGTNLELISVDGDVSYSGENTASVLVTGRGFTTILGEVVYGSPQQQTLYFTWDDELQLMSISV